MKKNIMVWLSAGLFLALLNGCCTKIWPTKIVFTPELDMAIKDKIHEKELKDPFVLLVGKDGRVFALSEEGRSFTPCRPPTIDETAVTKDQTARESMKQTDVMAQKAVMESDLPVCRGLKDIKGVLDIEDITIMKTRKNPIYRLVRTADGGLEEQCIPLPWESPSVCP